MEVAGDSRGLIDYVLLLTAMSLKILVISFGVNSWNLFKSMLKLMEMKIQMTKCHMKTRLFLEVFDLQKKFRFLIKKVPQKRNVVQRVLSACVEEQFNDFDIVRRIAENKQQENYVAIDIVYKPVPRIDQIVNYCFTSSIRNAYRAASHLEKGLENTAAEQCYACNKFFCRKKVWKVTWKRAALCQE